MIDQPGASLLTDADWNDFMALRRLCGYPHYRCLQDHHQQLVTENGQRLLPFLADAVRTLIEVGHATLAEPDPGSGGAYRPVLVTACGRARYEHLCDKQGIAAYPAIPGV